MSGEVSNAALGRAPIVERAVLVRMVVGVVVLVVAVGILGLAFRAPLSELAHAFVTRFGGLGVFLGMLFVDAYAAPPLAHEPLLFFAHAGGIGFLEVILIAGSGSFLAGPIGYGIGVLLSRLPWVRRQLERFELTPLIRRRGVWVVAVAAVSPIPFSASTYLAGALRVRFWPFLAACSLRYVKVAIYLGLIALGWQLA